ncbi:extracellular solute-binding protein [Candidatus Albibeggiatoa sp. nov. NOAA]|uniref:extracellular solute-binding protein n=1 Tax=Candidatus Albibeggiatoa sp. nov. NOAA TaxID=3162724 RepID=UPI0032F7BCC3|nr:extracellular solute-binding protein [Thiotrichaceae bacterium]
MHYIFILFLSLFYTTSLQAAPSAALGYTPKYANDFKNFDYINPNAPKGGELLIYNLGNFDSFNPFVLKGLAEGFTGELRFESLMSQALDEPFSLYGLIAKDIELAEDKLSVTFKLNPKARFSDGSKITAQDVKFSFDTLKSEQAHPRYRIYWNGIREAKVIDDQTVTFYFNKINPELHLVTAEIPIFKQTKEGEFSELVLDGLMGSGAYTIEKYQGGKYVTYKRNDDYWAKDLPVRKGMYNFDKVTVKYYKDSSIALEALKAGEFDVMAVYNSKQWARDFEGTKFDNKQILKSEFTHKNNAGMQGFVFNMRNPIFQDVRVRRAINLAFDFEWANKNLFYNQYERCNSYFSNSDLAAVGEPTEAELALLKPLQKKYSDIFPQEALTQAWQPVSTSAPNSLRKNLRQAKKLLNEAGWKVKDGVLQNEKGQKLEFKVMLFQRAFERILAPFARNLEKLGIKIHYRAVDAALYQQRQESFDFDMVVTIFGQSQSPGNELLFMWHSDSADRQGSQNLIGLKNPVVDALIEKVIYAENREALVTAVKALDRVMLFGEYTMPNWYSGHHRLAYWDKFGYPEQLPLYYTATEWLIRTWWYKQD